ncbi:benzoate/H(+) symporter BenE family transporter [Acinetobacter sp. B51(2017)]|uniref:benzoate/H(+) symporter BenE family transporter n=1 Tax=Acinetobacter sp. B51(2017) TaxID=2060938 RepID=UPI000F08AB87|nr:benzoate/H(+) symporter BenE family transporter [Acinetobacter sp. B51(2017)]
MHQLLRDFSVPAAFAGFITCLVGISVSAVLVIQTAQGLGANQAQISSWFWALCLGIGRCGLGLSWRFKYPVATSWSTAGLAMILASASNYSLHEAIGAFVVCGILTAILGFSGIFGRILAFIPTSLTAAMLGGVLLKFGVQLFSSLNESIGFIVLLLAVYVLSKRFMPRYSIVITVLAAMFSSPFFMVFEAPQLSWGITHPVWMTPEFNLAAILGLALPLLVINMASQYLPGIAIIQAYGYQPHVKHLIGWTGAVQSLLAPFGCFSVNTAAISAAISLDDQAHPDPKRRYIAGMSSGLCYLLVALFAATLTQALLSFPNLLITAVAGIALFGTISHNISLAFSDAEHREAALITFLMSASGVQFLNIGSAFWGLLLGLIVTLILRPKKAA